MQRSSNRSSRPNAKKSPDRSSRIPIEALKNDHHAGPAAEFFQAVTAKPTRRPVNLIAEVKKASPSAGIIRGPISTP